MNLEKCDDEVQIRPASRKDVKQLSHVLARAFDDEPIYRWVFPDEDSRRENGSRFFRVFLNNTLRDGLVHTTEQLDGASLWAVPGRPSGGFLSRMSLIFQMTWILGKRASYVGRELGQLERSRPHKAHWYLSFLGTVPDRQGNGIGTALLRAVLSHCDEKQLTAHLITATEENVAYYEHRGFRVTQTSELPHGPSAWSMTRQPIPGKEADISPAYCIRKSFGT
jgi:ribosomal protein S18 acetylase RimI-like enzyme